MEISRDSRTDCDRYADCWIALTGTFGPFEEEYRGQIVVVIPPVGLPGSR